MMLASLAGARCPGVCLKALLPKHGLESLQTQRSGACCLFHQNNSTTFAGGYPLILRPQTVSSITHVLSLFLPKSTAEL